MSEIETTIKILEKEHKGLKYAKQRIEADDEIPLTIKNRFRDIIRTLSAQVESIIFKFQTELNDPGYHDLTQLDLEYNEALLNIDRLLRTTMQSKTQIAHFADEIKPNEGVVDSDQEMLEEMKAIVKRLRHKLENHKHTDMRKEISKIRRSNVKIAKRHAALATKNSKLRKNYQVLWEKYIGL